MMKPMRELTPKEIRSIRKLVTSKCASYDKEYGCLPLSGTPQNHRFCGERRSSGMNELWADQTEASDMELVTTSECPMLNICYTHSAMCSYFRESVLPNDPELSAAFQPLPTKSCKYCGKSFPVDGRKVYCSANCANAASREQTAARVRKHRKKKADM